MAIIKCKMCGGDIQLAEDKTFGTCEYCGSVMTLPRVSDEQRAAAFNRGNHFRRAGEFDKAAGVFKKSLWTSMSSPKPNEQFTNSRKIGDK